MTRWFILLISFWLIPASLHAESVDLQEQVRRIAAELRCPVCQALSVADSPSEMAQQMRAIIQQQLKEGKSPDEVKTYFISKYGEWVMLAPTAKGFSLLIWILPFVALGGGILFVVFTVRRWVKTKPEGRSMEPDPALVQRVKQDLARQEDWEVAPDIEGPQVPLLRERARLYRELQELELYFQAGKLSDADYHESRQRYEEEASIVLQELDSSIPSATINTVKDDATKSAQPASHRGWVLAGTGAFLLLFGATLGIFLSKSLRPRSSPEDSITGDFLTGTSPQSTGAGSRVKSKNIESLLIQGRDAFERKEWPQAIEAFKGALTLDSNHPEAHTYMGLILTQAGHTDSALLAFNRALLNDPNFPLALWGKGMLLYRAKEDFSGARQTLGRLLSIMPPGVEKNEIQKTITELSSRQKE
ncbi:MAG: cytochrome c-type biogenesis protein CcmH, partial [Deltaproteobacteria bacterium]|nr:cytochrome c-type biogenesis protein CcmH [Deltaproteobacteria bacterium]